MAGMVMTVNERKFVETALSAGLRVDGRDLFDYRKLGIKFGSEDGSAEVHLGQTRVLAFVTSQLAQPYRDRPNEGMLSVFTEFSPMADPSFEPGRPGDSAIELGRVIDRGLRESRAVDMESLCVLSGKLAWVIRIDLHIIDNGGNLIDAANIAALAGLLTSRRPECSLGGESGQDVIIHPPEVREPLSLIVHHLPIAVTFAIFDDEGTVVIDPTYLEEEVMGGRITATLNTNGDVCAIQKAGGMALPQTVIMHCIRMAATKAGDMTSKIKEAVDVYNMERTQRKIKRHPLPGSVGFRANVEKKQKKSQPLSAGGDSVIIKETEGKVRSIGGNRHKDGSKNSIIGSPSSWDPYSRGVDTELLKLSLTFRESSNHLKPQEESQSGDDEHLSEGKTDLPKDMEEPSRTPNTARSGVQSKGEKTLMDAVKPKHKREKKNCPNVTSRAMGLL